MICRLIEIGGRSYALVFTVRSVVAAQERLGVPFETLFARGAAGLSGLVYAALLENHPRITLDFAAALCKKAAGEGKLEQLRDAVLRAFDDSGFDKHGETRASFENLASAAAKAGYPAPHTLAGLGLNDIHRALEAHLTALRYKNGLAQPMRDNDMRRALLSFARRHNDERS